MDDKTQLCLVRILELQGRLAELLRAVYHEAGLVSTTRDRIDDLMNQIESTKKLIRGY